MNTQELTQELHQPGAQELLRSGPLARLAYNGHDGFPRVIPIGFYWNGERIVVCTAPTSPKFRALSSRPNVALTIDTGDTPATAKSLLVRGLATMETVDGVPDEYIAAAAKTMDPSTVVEFERGVRSFYKQMVRISIEPLWARFFDFGAGRLPTFLGNLMSGGESDSASNTAR
jgi:nitroimidazol reductase NimA-like FMN-containing flavoprotein (pyridoxamine 5'-phosphate oxidase superfamily)